MIIFHREDVPGSDGKYYITDTDAGFTGWTDLFNFFNKNALYDLCFQISGKIGINILDSDADPCWYNLSVSNKIGNNSFGRINRYGKTDALGFGIYGGINSDKITIYVQKRPSTVARVNRGVSLNKVMIYCFVCSYASVYGADDTGRYRVGESEWIADGEYRFADHQIIGITHLYIGQRFLGRDTKHRKVRVRICAHNLGLEFSPVFENNSDGSGF